MIRQNIFINRYGWTMDILYDARPCNAAEIVDRLADMGCSMNNLCHAEDLIRSGIPNQGLTYTDNEEKHTMIVIGHATTVSAFFNTFAHECSHAVDGISRYYGINPYSEENAYLTGELSELIWSDAIQCAKELWRSIN